MVQLLNASSYSKNYAYSMIFDYFQAHYDFLLCDKQLT